MGNPSEDVTELLHSLSQGDTNAEAKLIAVVYGELRRLAAFCMRRERPDHTLQATALVHEAFMRLTKQREVIWQGKAHFFGIAAQIMRRILVDHARAHLRVKRGAGAQPLSLDENLCLSDARSTKLLVVNDSLNRLAKLDPRQARIVELRFFGGLSVEETAKVIGVSPKTVKRDWSLAKAWLHAELRATYGNDSRRVVKTQGNSTGFNLNQLVVSSDGGLTWGVPVTAHDQNAGLVTSMAIQPNGSVVVLGRNGGPNGDQEYAIRSLDGGHTLEATANIATSFFIFPFMRADPSLTSGVDADGTIYVVFPDCRFRTSCSDPVAASGCRFVTDNSSCTTNDLLLTKSKDGVTWSKPRRIPIDSVNSTVDHIIAGIGVYSDPYDHEKKEHVKLAVTYYFLPNGLNCQPDTCQVSAGFILSEDGGSSWKDAEKIAGPMMESWLAPTFAGEMVANYNSAVFINGKPHGAFAIARRPDPKTGKLDEAIYAGELAKEQD